MAQTRETLLAVLQRTVDPGWLDGILADPDSAAVLDAQLDMLVAVSAAVERNGAAGLISSAPGGEPGVTTLVAERAITTQAAIIPKGYTFVDDRGVLLILQTDVPVAVGQAVVALPLETLRDTDLVETVNGAFDFLAPGSFLDAAVAPQSPVVNDGVSPVLGPPGTGTSGHFLTLVTSDPITGGALDYLSAHGNERGQRRQAHEQTEDYRLRVRNIPDTVSPHAIAQAVRNVASRAGIAGVIVREPFDDGADPALKDAEGLGVFETYYTTGLTDPAASPKADFFDDPFYAPSPIGGARLQERETVSNREGRAYFRVETPGAIRDPDQLRFFADDGFCDDPVDGYLDVVNHPAVISALMSIWEEADRKRAAGVQFDVVLPLAQEKVGAGHVMAAAPVLVVTLTPAPGTSWIMVDTVAGHDAARSGTVPDPQDDSHYLVWTFTDSSTFTGPLWTRTDSQHLNNETLAALGFPFSKRVSRIQGFLDSGAGTRDLGLVVEARILEFTE